MLGKHILVLLEHVHLLLDMRRHLLHRRERVVRRRGERMMSMGTGRRRMLRNLLMEMRQWLTHRRGHRHCNRMLHRRGRNLRLMLALLIHQDLSFNLLQAHKLPRSGRVLNRFVVGLRLKLLLLLHWLRRRSRGSSPERHIRGERRNMSRLGDTGLDHRGGMLLKVFGHRLSGSIEYSVFFLENICDACGGSSKVKVLTCSTVSIVLYRA